MQTTFLDTCKSFTLTAVTIFSVKFILDSKIFSWQQIFQDNNILFSLWSLPSRFYPSICIYKYSQVIISSLFFYRWSDSGLKGGLLCFQHEEKKRRSLYIYIYIYIRSTIIYQRRGEVQNHESRVNRYWFLGINGRDYSPTFGQNKPKKRGRVAVQDKLLGSELCLLVFRSKTGKFSDFCFSCIFGK
jgi:hypothetical protein